jgi:HPr kinase/phosphorylase
MPRDSVTVERLYAESGARLQLKLLSEEKTLKRVILEPTVNRPGLVLSGFTRYFAFRRVQVIGNAEAFFLKSLSEEERARRYELLFSFKVPCVVFSRSLYPDKAFLKAADQAKAPIFRCPLVTMKFINLATLALEMMFAPRGIEMGSMVDILGVGVILRGESGIGKSESVLALIERGYSLVSDDITRVMLVDGREVIGTSAEVTRNHMEVRGIGIVDVAAMFGVRSIRKDKRVDLVITLKSWNEVEDVDRLGLEQQYVKILGIDIPHIVIPVRPGRDLARLIEVAAFQAKLRSAGYNPAKEFNDRLIERMKVAANPSK